MLSGQIEAQSKTPTTCAHAIVIYYYKMKLLTQILILLTVAWIFEGCSSQNEKAYLRIAHNFEDSIQKYNAKKYDYTADILRPQISYFVGSKLKFLTLTSGAEFCDGESKCMIDPKSDSIILIIERIVCYEDHNRWTKKSDTIYYTNYRNKTVEKIANGKSVEKKQINSFDDPSYVNEIIRETEKKHNN